MVISTRPISAAFAATIAAFRFTPNALSGSVSPVRPARSLSSTSVGSWLLKLARSPASPTRLVLILADAWAPMPMLTNRLPYVAAALRAVFWLMPIAVALVWLQASTSLLIEPNTTLTLLCVSARSLAMLTAATPAPNIGSVTPAVSVLPASVICFPAFCQLLPIFSAVCTAERCAFSISAVNPAISATSCTVRRARVAIIALLMRRI